VREKEILILSAAQGREGRKRKRESQRAEGGKRGK